MTKNALESRLRSTLIPKQTSQLIQNLIDLDTPLTYYLSKYNKKQVYDFINKLYNVLLFADLEDVGSDLYCLSESADSTSRYNSMVVTYILNYHLGINDISTVVDSSYEPDYLEIDDQIAYKYFVEGYAASEIAEMYLLATPTVYKYLLDFTQGEAGANSGG